MTVWFVSLRLCAIVVGLLAATTGLSASQGQLLVPDGLTVPVSPARRGAALPPPAPPPSLPPGADAVTPQTIRLMVTALAQGRAIRSARQTVTRTLDHVHIALADGTEWLFERNPIDHRRVSGFAMLHSARVIVAYSDTDLRAMLGITGWGQVLTFGCASSELLPTECVARDGASRTRVEGVSPTIDQRLVALPAERFPGYREVNVADWLEDQ